jgi:hypothetical protein
MPPGRTRIAIETREVAGAPGPAASYEERVAAFAREWARYDRRAGRNGNLSLALFLATLAAGALALWQGGPVPYTLTALLGITFLAAFFYQGRLSRTRDAFETLRTINEEGLARLRRDWTHLPEFAPVPSDHPYAADLDLAGHASLLHLLGTPNTPAGRAALAHWVLHPAPPAVARERQAAVAELAPLVELRDRLALHGRSMGTVQPDYERFLDWAERDGWLRHRPALVWASRLLALLALSLLAAQVAGLVPGPYWLAVAAVNLLLDRLTGGQVGRILGEVAARQTVFRAYADLFGLATRQTLAAPALRRLQAALSADGLAAGRQMERLGRIMRLFELRRSQLFFVIQALTLWNYHVLWLLERWQRAAGPHARGWLAAAGELEALAALATLAHDHPRWAFPALVETAGAPADAVLTARDLGHPLLPPDLCVGNDLTLGPPGTFLFVTGSNMSGKSTLLRAIGVNVALAQAGGPVCATALTLPPVALATSIRVQDSLEYGVSYYMAELQRLKGVVEIARAARAEGASLVLFLLDEILHGTNTHERQIAARQIIRHLLRLGTTGAVSTHDLTLADAPDLAALARAVHFTESFARGPDGPTMRFDYKLRPGIATSTNALKLMEIVGLPLEEEPDAGT